MKQIIRPGDGKNPPPRRPNTLAIVVRFAVLAAAAVAVVALAIKR